MTIIGKFPEGRGGTIAMRVVSANEWPLLDRTPVFDHRRPSELHYSRDEMNVNPYRDE